MGSFSLERSKKGEPFSIQRPYSLSGNFPLVGFGAGKRVCCGDNCRMCHYPSAASVNVVKNFACLAAGELDFYILYFLNPSPVTTCFLAKSEPELA